jgi:hypothetical protein
MRTVSAAAIIVALMAPTLNDQISAAEHRYWVGQLKVAEFQFAKNTAEAPGPDAGHQWESADLTTYIYKVYQNSAGVVRHELTSMSRKRGLEPGLDVQIFNYPEGYMVSFNKGAKSAPKARMPIPGGVSSRLESRQILGHVCKGTATKWTNLNKYAMLVESWTPADGDFRDPLLKITTISDQSGHLWTIKVEIITDLEKADRLDDVLFRVPSGLALDNLP